MLTILGRRSSFNLQKVAWLIGEIGCAHRHIEVGGSFGGLDTPEFRLMNPHGRVPVIKDGDHIVWESQAILRYLAATHGGEAFWSEDPRVRAKVDQWMDWSQTCVQPDFLNGVFWGFYRTPAEQRNEAAVARSVARCADHFRLVDDVMGDRPFLLGEQLSLADITIGTHLYRYFELEIERPPIANVEAYYERLQERPAYRDNVMVPFDELFGRLAF